MDIREYSYVLSIADCGSITKAAQALYVSQPSLSIYLHSLEKRLNITFFEKNGRYLKPTPEGLVYIEAAKKIVFLHEEVHNRLESMRRLECGTVRIGVTVTRGAFLLPELMRTFRTMLPGIDVMITEARCYSG